MPGGIHHSVTIETERNCRTLVPTDQYTDYEITLPEGGNKNALGLLGCPGYSLRVEVGEKAEASPISRQHGRHPWLGKTERER